MSAGDQPVLDAQSPWLGLASFTEETRGFFYGREDEVAELGRRVQRKLLTVLFGQSGLGKTSILRAGIVPRLRPEGYCPVYVRIDYSPDSPPPSEQIKQAIFHATESSGQWTQPGTAEAGESLWEFLHHRDDILRDAAGKTVIPLLIFDQFEEIFTIAQGDDAGRARAATFLADLADLVENRPPKALESRMDTDDSVIQRFDFSRADYRILIALREDYLAHLEGVKGVMPSITQNRMRLARMTGTQALAAVVKPGGKLVSQEVAESIVRFVAGGAELRNAEVEPSLLSLICRELNNARIAQGRAEISADLLAGSHDTILNEFYERALEDQPAEVRRFIEDEMLTESGYRESLAEERVVKAFTAAGARPDALATLVNRRLLRIEERLDLRRVELTHDVLCTVVGASRGLRHEREAKDAAERQLLEQKAREEATQKALVRARKFAAVCGVLAIGAVVGAIFGYVNMERAREAEAKAEQTRKLAEGARAESEKLVVYLLEDFQVELEPIGRLDLVASLSKRALDYYGGLPVELQTPATLRNRSLAEVRYALSMRNLGRLDEAAKAAQSAVNTLARLKAEGDSSEPTLIGLAMGTGAQGRIFSQQARFVEARKAGKEAFDMLRPGATAPGASVPIRRAFGEVATTHGFNAMRDGDHTEAVATLDDARTVLRSIDGLKLTDLSSAALFVEATAWQMDSLTALRRPGDSRKVGEEGRKVADGVLEKQPGHMLALRARGLLLGNFGELESEQLRFRSALPFYASAARDYESYVKVDGGNAITWNNLGTQYMSLGLYTEASGQPREGLKYLRAAARTGQQAGMTAIRAVNVAFVWWQVARVEAEIGNVEAARKAIDEGTRMVEIALRDAPPQTFRRTLWEAWRPLHESQLLLINADASGAAALAVKAAAQLEQVKPENETQKRIKAVQLADALWTQGWAAYQLKDYAGAIEPLRRAVEVRNAFPPDSRIDELFRAEARLSHVLALARAGRPAQAREALAPVEKYFAALPSVEEADWVRMRLASLRLAQALANPGEAGARLEGATRYLDGLAPELRSTATVMQIRKEVAAELAARR